MKKSLWMESMEWAVLGLVALFLTGVIVMRDEITSSPGGTDQAPLQSIGE